MTRTRYVSATIIGSVSVAAVIVGLIALAPGAFSSTPVAELSFPTLGGGGGSAASPAYSADALLGQPDATASASADGQVSLVPGPIGGEVSATAADACPDIDGPALYAGCPAAARSTTTLKVTDQKPTPTACGNKPSCTMPETRAPVKVYDRNKLNGLTITKRDGISVKLTKNPDGTLYDDIFESQTAYDAARAANYGCTTDASGTCTAGVRQPGDLLLLVRFSDVSNVIYAGRSLTVSSFVDTDGNGAVDLATESIQVNKQIDKNGVISYMGGKNTPISAV